MGTDEAWVARCTELVRRAWPDGQEQLVVAGEGWAGACLSDGDATMLQVRHPRARDMLEAALLVGAEQGDFEEELEIVAREVMLSHSHGEAIEKLSRFIARVRASAFFKALPTPPTGLLAVGRDEP